MRVLVLGSSGMLGIGVCQSLRSYEVEVHGTIQEIKKSLLGVLDLDHIVYYNALDATDSDLNLPVNLIDYDCVINCIGIINRKADQNKENTISINSVFPHRVSRMCEAKNVPFIHISTDCVFNGDSGGYTESCIHTALDIYGRTKSLGEPSNCMVLRTSIIGEEIHTFSSLIEWVKEQKGKTIHGYTNHKWNGITTIQYGSIVHKILREGFYQKGLYHIFSPAAVSKYSLVNMIAKKFKIDLEVIQYETETSIDRTLCSNKPLVSLLDIPPIERQLEKLSS